MHFVSRIEPASAKTPEVYLQNSTGFRRATYVDRAMGSVHMGTGICYLDAHGVIQPHMHSFEESFYILEGSVILQINEQAYELGPGQFGLIGTGVPHGWRTVGDTTARWLE
ncbi:MAG TPA: cupin domain-containing protein, partial [Anaerolineales bacterium]|nr:cupin domain-containing protein [Anaerolineales bacterium]